MIGYITIKNGQVVGATENERKAVNLAKFLDAMALKVETLIDVDTDELKTTTTVIYSRNGNTERSNEHD